MKKDNIKLMEESKKKSGYTNQYTKAKILGLPIPKGTSNGKFFLGKKHTEETKKKLSEIRKKYLKENSHKHPWKRDSKFISKPCEYLKNKLKELNILFQPEFEPLREKDIYYSIDIAFPDKKIGIEVNGRQHYDSDGNLLPYYQERHDLIEAEGWKLYEIYYSSVFNEEKITDIINQILKSDIKLEFSYINYIPKQKVKKKYYCTCGNEIYKGSKRCRLCFLKDNKTKRPTKEELEKLINQHPMTVLGKMFNVSDNCVKKWCKYYEIELGDRRGYWTKLKYSINIDNKSK